MSTKRFLLFISFIFLAFFLLSFFFHNKEEKNEIIFLDVGQGSSALIKTKSGKNILVDTGNEKQSVRALTRELGFFNRKLDIIFISHYDLDHIGLLPFYLKYYKVSLIIDNGVTKMDSSQKSIFNEIKRLIEEKNIKYLKVSEGDEIILNDNLKIKVLFPGRFLNVDKLKSNSGSLVLQIFMDNKKILLMGDLPKKFENVLVKRFGSELKSDILLAGHHGSKTSSGELFLETVSPENFIISVGGNNSYGHPNEEVLERVIDFNFNILRTDILGNISF